MNKEEQEVFWEKHNIKKEAREEESKYAPDYKQAVANRSTNMSIADWIMSRNWSH